jgi:hypothetical protein
MWMTGAKMFIPMCNPELVITQDTLNLVTLLTNFFERARKDDCMGLAASTHCYVGVTRHVLQRW